MRAYGLFYSCLRFDEDPEESSDDEKKGMKWVKKIRPIKREPKIRGVRNPNTGQKAERADNKQTIPTKVAKGIALGAEISHGKLFLATYGKYNVK